jgi:hypothetical protein
VANDPLAGSRNGYLWDSAVAKKKDVKLFGEFVPDRAPFKKEDRTRTLAEWRSWQKDFRNRYDWHARTPDLDSLVVHDYPGWDLSVPDVVRARIFLSHLKEYEQKGDMPSLSIVLLPCDHGRGVEPGSPSPGAFVADNDLALGQIVDGLSHSRFWKDMAIFVIEDDPGGFPDHVDFYRTAALVVSPYARRRSVDSTFYSQASVVKSIELILGLPTLSLFDLIANDMRNAFTNEPDFTPYSAVVPAQDLTELVPPLEKLSGPARAAVKETRKMRFDIPDAIPMRRYASIMWHVERGWGTPVPAPAEASFSPAAAPDRDSREGGERER